MACFLEVLIKKNLAYNLTVVFLGNDTSVKCIHGILKQNICNLKNLKTFKIPTKKHRE